MKEIAKEIRSECAYTYAPIPFRVHSSQSTGSVMSRMELTVGSFMSLASYEEVVKEVLADERQYLRDLHMITRLFRDVVVRNNLHRDSDQLDAIFSNINDLTELTNTLIGLLEVS